MIDLRRYIRDIPDFPKPGVLFRDITPLLAEPAAFAEAVERMAGPFEGEAIDRVLAIEARGFIFGAAIAQRRGAGLILARKPGKLPWRTLEASYALEYSETALSVHRDAVAPGSRVLVVDDVLATGGTAAAAARLVGELGGEVAGLTFLIELQSLGGRARLGGRRAEAVLVL